MGAEALPTSTTICGNGNGKEGPLPLVLGLQASALVDHVARVDSSLLDQIPGDRGGSIPVATEELEHILGEVKNHIIQSPNDSSAMKTLAGGSVANTIRGLSAGFGISCGIIGACGDDTQGQLFVSNMSSNCVNLTRMRMNKGPTAQCVCLVDDMGNRTMRPCLSSAVKLKADELNREDFKGGKWLILRFSAIHLEVTRKAIQIAKEEGLLISLDLASFEMVRNFREPLVQLLESGNIDLCFANEDEATELLSDCKGGETTNPVVALEFLAKHCKWAVVTLGRSGSIAKHGNEIVRVPAVGVANATDATGAGDLFASGFVYGLLKGLSLEECCKVGSCSGGSVIHSLGGEVTPEDWHWMYKQMQVKGIAVPEIRM